MKKTNDQSMWRGASSGLFKKADKLRQEMTEAETILWERLRANQLLGYKFRRQHPISIYIADFYCHKLSLIIEVDGKYHNKKEQIINDEKRTEDLKFQGMKILRFTNQEVVNNIETVILKIKGFIMNEC
jgi:very-short-patch-repair endonuclease